MVQSVHAHGVAAQAGLSLGHSTGVPAFEERMVRDSRWALSEGSKFFEGGGAVQATLRKIAKRLAELQIPYAVAGGMALSNHGFPRFTVDVDILVTADGLKEVHNHLDGLGYLPPFTHSKNLRDTETGVKIDFLITGGFPGDGKPKPVAFPDPSSVTVENDGIRYINLSTLIELKIASGMTSSERIKDLADVQELIKILALSKNYGDTLNPYVHHKYLELWRAARPADKRYVALWSVKFATIDANRFNEINLADANDPEVAMLNAMLADGVSVEPQGGNGENHTYLVTTDPDIARKYGMHDASEFWNEPVESSKPTE